LEGRILDVLVDLRKESVSYLKIETLYMGPDELNSIYVPAGVAHGFLALENSITFYISDKAHSLVHDKGVHIESLGIEFPMNSILLSDRDKELPNLDLWIKNYT
jgi:dTDP-4-dehydrorhamnose 3,5-epimerase